MTCRPMSLFLNWPCLHSLVARPSWAAEQNHVRKCKAEKVKLTEEIAKLKQEAAKRLPEASLGSILDKLPVRLVQDFCHATGGLL